MRIGREYRFEIAHSLPHLPEGHKCRRPHGHGYWMRVWVEGPMQPDLAWIMDYADIDAVVKRLVVDVLDHRDINEYVNPSTCENLVLWCWNRLKAELPLCKIEMKEVERSIVEYEGK